MFVSVTSPVVLCMYNFVFYSFFIYNYSIYASGWFVRKENNKCTPRIITIMFKNILRIFGAEILKIFKNIQPQPKIYTFL